MAEYEPAFVITRLLGYSKYGVGQKMVINKWIYYLNLRQLKLYYENKAETKQRECAAAAGGDAAKCQRARVELSLGFYTFRSA